MAVGSGAVLFGLLVVLSCFVLAPQAAQVINLHIGAHTHDDVGWLKTVDEYFYGANNTIQEAGVQYILDTVIQQLSLNPRRRFIYVEIAFFARWWNEQNEETRSLVRNLVQEKRLEFVNAGWSMNDEATTLYPATIDQMTEGHRFVYQNFGVRPNIGWQIDPFGHSSTQAALFAQMGFDAVFFARSDYQDYDRRKKAGELEFIWRPSTSLGKTTDIFTHIFWDSTYCTAGGFSFQDDNVQPVMADSRLEDYNVDKIAQRLVNIAKERAGVFRTSNIWFTFGCDFQYMNAAINFKNMDYLIDYINERQSQFGVNVFYSTPSTYVDAVHKESEERKIVWPLNLYDFFPYRDDAHSVWAGYFNSRAALKGYVRISSNLFHSISNLLTTASGVVRDVLTDANFKRTDTLAQAMGLCQHHDAVSGTEKLHVAKDYARHLAGGTIGAQQLINDVVAKLFREGKSRSAPIPTFTFCNQLNVSVCPATTSGSGPVPVVLYNPLAWKRIAHIRLPVPTSNMEIVDYTGAPVPSQVYTSSDPASKYTIAFSISLPALGYNTVVLQKKSSEKTAALIANEFSFTPSETQADVVLENSNLRVVISGATGRLASVQNKIKGIQLAVDQDIAWYNASAGNNAASNQPSGAYIFRPNGTDTFNISTNNVARVVAVVQGNVLQEVRQYWSDWAYQTLRLYSDADYLEAETTVGEIPINDHLGKEIITRYNIPSLATKSMFWTDSNGQEFQQRQRNFRPTYNLNLTEPVACNYYPIDTAAYMQAGPDSTGVRFTIIVDRAQGGGSLKDGEFEVMVHRRLLYDDFRGVGEPLNQTDVVRSLQWTLYDRPADSARRQRTLSLEMNGAPQIFFAQWSNTASDFFSTYNTAFTPLSNPLPPNVHLLNLRTLDTGETLLRLNHIYAVGEDAQYSTTARVDLANLFSSLTISSIREMSLTANQPVGDLHRYSWNTTSSTAPSSSATTTTFLQPYTGAVPSVIELQPMQIRTFLIRFMHV